MRHDHSVQCLYGCSRGRMNTAMSGEHLTAPRTIYALWLQGEEAAPALVRLNFRRWASMNPDHELRILNADDVDRLLVGFPLPPAQMTVQALSDVLRARLLLEGGVWSDASVFPTEPLDAWLPDRLQDAGFFAFERPGVDRPLSSWFLAASRDHVMMRKWWAEIVRFWSRPRSVRRYIPENPVWEVSPNGGAAKDEYPYYWFHYLFGYLLETDADFAAHWDRCRKLSAGPPQLLHGLCADNRPEHNAVLETARAAPVHKLNWRRTYPLDILETLQ